MLNRRSFIVAAGAAALLARARNVLAKAAQPSTAVNFAVPAGACDCHTHIHGDTARFPFYPGRVYTPEMALPEEMASLHRSLGIQRVVIVTPSVYGTDNSATVYGMKAYSGGARGVAVIDDKTSDAELDDLVKLGFKGIRLNLATVGISDPAVARRQFTSVAERVKRLNWHVQLNTTLPVVAALKDTFAASPVPLVFDHFANANEELGTGQPGFADLVQLVRSGKAYVKISITGGPRKNYELFRPFAQDLIAANVDRIVWGSNWPHPHSTTAPGRAPTDVTPLWQVDDGLVLNLLPSWAPEAELRRRILVENAARLYGF